MLRGDNEAVNVRWEVISEEEEKKAGGSIVKEERLAQGTAHNPDTSIDNPSVDVGKNCFCLTAVSGS